MPDPTRKTLSGTQTPALWGMSPYVTEWMLFHWAESGAEIESPENERMAWGKRLERVILDAAADEIGAEVHDHQEYIRIADRGIGATVETICFHPTEGPGVIEAKNVDWKVWKTSWTEDAAPPHIEIQLQHEMLVWSLQGTPAKWGAIACLVGGNDLRVYRRTPDADFQAELIARAMEFWQNVELGIEPPVTGSERELPLINRLWPKVESIEPVKLGDDLVEVVQEYEHAAAQASLFDKREKAARAKLLAAMRDHGVGDLPGGRRVYVTKSQVSAATIQRKAYVSSKLSIGGSSDGL